MYCAHRPVYKNIEKSDVVIVSYVIPKYIQSSYVSIYFSVYKGVLLTSIHVYMHA